MAKCRTDIDWAARPYPWNEIGPVFRAECLGQSPERRAPLSQREIDARAIKNRRVALGLKQHDIDRYLGVHSGYTWSVEVGGFPGMVRRVAEALDRLERDSEVTRVTGAGG